MPEPNSSAAAWEKMRGEGRCPVCLRVITTPGLWDAGAGASEENRRLIGVLMHLGLEHGDEAIALAIEAWQAQIALRRTVDFSCPLCPFRFQSEFERQPRIALSHLWQAHGWMIAAGVLALATPLLFLLLAAVRWLTR